jgi:hypothetical protein
MAMQGTALQRRFAPLLAAPDRRRYADMPLTREIT